jgi:hypothetical protein
MFNLIIFGKDCSGAETSSVSIFGEDNLEPVTPITK